MTDPSAHGMYGLWDVAEQGSSAFAKAFVCKDNKVILINQSSCTESVWKKNVRPSILHLSHEEGLGWTMRHQNHFAKHWRITDFGIDECGTWLKMRCFLTVLNEHGSSSEPHEETDSEPTILVWKGGHKRITEFARAWLFDW